MIDPLKNLLLAGLGAVSYSQEKLKGTLHDLIDRGELTREQGERILSEWTSRGREESEQVSQRVSEEARKIIEKMGLVGRSEFEALAARVTTLEGGSRTSEK